MHRDVRLAKKVHQKCLQGSPAGVEKSEVDAALEHLGVCERFVRASGPSQSLKTTPR